MMVASTKRFLFSSKISTSENKFLNVIKSIKGEPSSANSVVEGKPSMWTRTAAAEFILKEKIGGKGSKELAKEKEAEPACVVEAVPLGACPVRALAGRAPGPPTANAPCWWLWLLP